VIRRVLLAFLVLLGLAGLGIVLLARPSFRRERVERPCAWPAKALEDDTLVLERWLGREGWTVRRGGGPLQAADLPRGGLVVLLRTAPGGLSRAEAEDLLAWTRDGGTLLVDGSAAPLENPLGTLALLGRLGVELRGVPHAERVSAEQQDEFESDGRIYAIRRDPAWRLRASHKAWPLHVGADPGDVLLARDEGRGRLILAPDLSFLYNDAFIERDHAAWLARVLGPPRPGQKALVCSEPREASLPVWLWRGAWPFLVALGALLGAWLWGGLWRFGPWLPSPPPGRRSLLEHLVASGRFLWRQGGDPDALVAIARRAVLRRAVRIHPAFPLMAEGERWAFLAQRSGLGEGEIAEALDDRPGATKDVLGRRLQALLHLRHRLSQKA
jgi:hypothetical protein